jgi:hypothetical protein
VLQSNVNKHPAKNTDWELVAANSYSNCRVHGHSGLTHQVFD